MNIFKEITKSIGAFVLGFILVDIFSEIFINQLDEKGWLTHILFAVLYLSVIVWIASSRVINAIKNNNENKS